MAAVLWMLIGAALTLALCLIVVVLLAEFRRRRVCFWCERVSGHRVTGHTETQCQGPHQQRQAEERHQADLERTHAEWRKERKRNADRAEARIALDSSKMRLVKVGTITTRSTGRRVTVDIKDWAFDTPGPFNGFTPGGTQHSFNATGSPEKFHGWTLAELHLIAHGGQCRCDVIR